MDKITWGVKDPDAARFLTVHEPYFTTKEANRHGKDHYLNVETAKSFFFFSKNMCNFFANTFENIENTSHCLCYVTTPFLFNCNTERFQKHTCNYIPNIVKVQCTFEISDRLQHGKERGYNHSQDV